MEWIIVFLVLGVGVLVYARTDIRTDIDSLRQAHVAVLYEIEELYKMQERIEDGQAALSKLILDGQTECRFKEAGTVCRAISAEEMRKVVSMAEFRLG